MELSASVRISSTRPAAAAFAWTSRPGREIQLKAWIGSTVKPSKSQAKEMNGNSPVIGGAGRNAMNVSAPIVISGAVSPSA